MHQFIKQPVSIGYLFYSMALIAYGTQQFVYGNFRNVQLPAWQSHLPGLVGWAYVTGLILILSGIAIITHRWIREITLVLGSVFLSLFLFVHIPFQIFGEIHSSLHLGLWVDALKQLALAGGAFVIAGSSSQSNPSKKSGSFLRLLENLIPFGQLFFCIPLICFGITHFMYAEHVTTLVPAWFPDRIFWNYFSAVALISAGIAIILKLRDGFIACLLSVMLFLWVILLHVPRAVADPLVARGNEISSAFDALAFCGTALVISLGKLKRDLQEMFAEEI